DGRLVERELRSDRATGEVRQRGVVENGHVLLDPVAELVLGNNVVVDVVTVTTTVVCASLGQDRRLLLLGEGDLEGTDVQRPAARSTVLDGVPLEVVLERASTSGSVQLVADQAIVVEALVALDVEGETLRGVTTRGGQVGSARIAKIVTGDVGVGL